LPLRQAQLLALWERLGIPYDWKKQLHGRQLEIIGFDVDTPNLLLTLTVQKKEEFVAALREFVRVPGRKRPLLEWWRMQGWFNWILNVFPLARFALQSSYQKTAGKTHRAASVYLNKSVKRDLEWAADYVEASEGIVWIEDKDW
ncbi:hypothetical protein BT69DRAFT_1185977, partial [Atractiella rhizophila]